MESIARLTISIEDDEDYLCEEEFFVKVDETFEDSIKALDKLIDEECADFDEVEEFINSHFTQVKLTKDYNFNI